MGRMKKGGTLLLVLILVGLVGIAVAMDTRPDFQAPWDRDKDATPTAGAPTTAPMTSAPMTSAQVPSTPVTSTQSSTSSPAREIWQPAPVIPTG